MMKTAEELESGDVMLESGCIQSTVVWAEAIYSCQSPDPVTIVVQFYSDWHGDYQRTFAPEQLIPVKIGSDPS